MSSFNKLHSANVHGIYLKKNDIMTRTIMIFEVVSNFILFGPGHYFYSWCSFFIIIPTDGVIQ